jgi:hypothetical protein
VHLYVDYTVPVEAVRKKLNEIAAQPKLWNGKVVNLQVTARIRDLGRFDRRQFCPAGSATTPR